MENHSLNIVLFEPQIPQNTGNIARTCAATGATLHLVGPLGFKIDDKKLKRAGLDYWDLLDIRFYEDVDDFYEKVSGEFFYFTTKGGNVYSDNLFPNNSYIIFGREDAGISESILSKNLDRCLRIPMISDARSLNLSNSVAIATYEVLRQWNFPELLNEGKLSINTSLN
jgi:tRNA (cytidine/uridine-2'-O-)-methyltransferase